MKTRKNMKTNALLKAAAIIVVIIALGACQALSDGLTNGIKDAISFESVSLTKLTFNAADMVAKIKVQNDNSFPIPLPEIKWNLFVADRSLSSGKIEDDTTIAARGSTIVDLPLSVTYEGLYKTIATLLSEDEAPYRIDLDTLFSVPVLGKETFAVSFDGSIPLLKLPKLSVEGVKVIPPTGLVDLTKLDFILTWQVENNNRFDLNLNKLNYNFAVNNSTWADTSISQSASIASRNTTNVPITASISTVSMIAGIIAMAARGDTVNYTCTGEFSLSPQGSPKGLEKFTTMDFPLDLSGSTTLGN